MASVYYKPWSYSQKLLSFFIKFHCVIKYQIYVLLIWQVHGLWRASRASGGTVHPCYHQNTNAHYQLYQRALPTVLPIPTPPLKPTPLPAAAHHHHHRDHHQYPHHQNQHQHTNAHTNAYVLLLRAPAQQLSDPFTGWWVRVTKMGADFITKREIEIKCAAL